MTNSPTPFGTVAGFTLQADDPVDLHKLGRAMDVILAKPDEATREEMLAVIRLVAPVVGRFVMLRGALADEVLRMELDEAKPEGRA